MEMRCSVKRISLLLLVTTCALFGVIFAATHDFVPDAVFKGSSLTALQTLGAANWRAENGEITGAPTNPDGGWLVFDKSYQDIQFYSDFRCSAACNAGILLRAQKTSSGGLRGVYISLVEGDTDSYDLELNSEGKEVSRTKLGRAAAQFSRIATGQCANGNAQVPGFARTAPTLEEYQAEGAQAGSQAAARAGGAGRGAAPATGRGAAGAPGRGGPGRGGASLAPNEWNSVQLIVDTDMVWTTLNGRRGFGNGATNDHMMGFGPVALHVAGSGDVKFRDISFQDLIIKREPAEQVSPHFRMQR